MKRIIEALCCVVVFPFTLLLAALLIVVILVTALFEKIGGTDEHPSRNRQ